MNLNELDQIFASLEAAIPEAFPNSVPWETVHEEGSDYRIVEYQDVCIAVWRFSHPFLKSCWFKSSIEFEIDFTQPFVGELYSIAVEKNGKNVLKYMEILGICGQKIRFFYKERVQPLNCQ
jgi:hypothetical protein